METKSIVKKIRESFVIRDDAYAIQKNDGSYSCVKDSLTDEVINKHLKKEITIGAYQLDKSNNIKYICFDFDKDTKEDSEQAKKLFDSLKKEGYHPLLEDSGGGVYRRHVWLNIENMQSKDAREWAAGYCRKHEIEPSEFFPKQNSISEDGYGNFVKLPLSINKKTKKFCAILEGDIEHRDKIRYVSRIDENSVDNFSFFEWQTNVKQKQCESDQVLLYVLKNKIEKDCFRNNILFKNMAVLLVFSGLTPQRIIKIARIIVRNCPGTTLASFEGWLKKARSKEFTDFNKNELNAWIEKFNLPIKKYNNVENKELEIISIEDLLTSNIQPPEWLVEDILMKEGVTLIGGEAGCFKSFTGLHIMASLSEGDPVFGHFMCKKQKVLYIDEENGASTLKERLEKLKIGKCLKSPLQGGLSIFNEVKLDTYEGYERLDNAINKFKPDVIIVDSAVRVLTG